MFATVMVSRSRMPGEDTCGLEAGCSRTNRGREAELHGPSGRNANRSAASVIRADVDGLCDPRTRTSTSYAYDTGDRLRSDAGKYSVIP